MDEQAFNKQVGARVRTARENAELTQSALARLTGLTRGSITNIESGTQSTSLFRLAQIAAAARVQPADLIPNLAETSAASDLPDHLADAVAAVTQAAQRKMKVGHGTG
ncbi:helix-turn-helix domain-containing protein [Streptomyces mirabilis]|uniref:helix-turn-helix domain-containing protein n=1 Tax=Streptomyces mirabilis TaxID=68239 RepID=UPI000941F908|nr:helix-turn-helix transcriptional regulator [Streptomyces mirabilis]